MSAPLNHNGGRMVHISSGWIEMVGDRSTPVLYMRVCKHGVFSQDTHRPIYLRIVVIAILNNNIHV